MNNHNNFPQCEAQTHYGWKQMASSRRHQTALARYRTTHKHKQNVCPKKRPKNIKGAQS